jgi:mannose-1-phosphate guanylyltransferase/MurNAc alpha-1-phosphate uridylyltransferase
VTTAPAAVVLAAGRGRRLRPLTALRPKPLCPLGASTLLDRTLDRLAGLGLAGPEAVAVNAHHLARQVVDHVGDRAQLSVEPDLLGTAGAVGNLRTWLAGRPVLVANGDSYLSGAVDAMLSTWDGERVRLLVVRDPDRADFGPWRFAGLSLLPAADAAALEPRPSGLYETTWAPAERAGRLELVEFHGTFLDCGTPRDYLLANLHDSGGRSVIGAGAVVEGQVERSVVWPRAVVRRDERLVEAVRADGLTVDARG